jgi:hypothetical protein
MIFNPGGKCLGARWNSKQRDANAGNSLPDYRYSLESVVASLPLRVMVKHHQLTGSTVLRRSYSLKLVDI